VAKGDVFKKEKKSHKEKSLPRLPAVGRAGRQMSKFKCQRNVKPRNRLRFRLRFKIYSF
jgi:hypothetical protein